MRQSVFRNLGKLGKAVYGSNKVRSNFVANVRFAYFTFRLLLSAIQIMIYVY